MVPRTYQLVRTPNLQGFAGTSPGADVPPSQAATGFRHLRWLQSGNRNWSITSVILLAGDFPNPPDAGMPPPLDAPVIDAAPPVPDLAPPDVAVGPPDLMSSVDSVVSEVSSNTDTAVAPDAAPALDTAGPRDPGGASSGDGMTDPEPDAVVGSRRVDLQVGCACEVGGTRASDALPIGVWWGWSRCCSAAAGHADLAPRWRDPLHGAGARPNVAANLPCPPSLCPPSVSFADPIPAPIRATSCARRRSAG